MKELTRSAIDVARGAGRLLAEAYGRTLQISHKGAVDLVTDADHAAEDFILAELERRYPDHPVLSEEAGARAAEGPYRWVIDPLDGTVNFAHGLPHFAVLAAVQARLPEGRFETIAAVTFDPLRDELFVAEKGAGATLNGAPIRVSETSRLIDAVLATGFNYDRLFRLDDNQAEFCRLNLLTQGVRRNGSAGLDLAYVACGRLDGLWEYRLNPWDVAGGCLLVTEAQGRVGALEGGPLESAHPSVVASNGRLHTTLLEAIASARRLPANSRDGLEAFLPPEVAARLARTDRRSD
jgi:myo-inositol-1(or 4)-monophosphatase